MVFVQFSIRIPEICDKYGSSPFILRAGENLQLGALHRRDDDELLQILFVTSWSKILSRLR